jgi:hypothetical protein
MIPVLAIAGSLAAKKSVPIGSGTLQTHTPLFIVMLVFTVLLVGALTFVPALALGPIVEHLQLYAAQGPHDLQTPSAVRSRVRRPGDRRFVQQADPRVRRATR